MRLIDAGKLIVDIDEIRYACIGMRSGKIVLSAFARKYRDDIMQTIANQPTVDAVEVVHGVWIPEDLYIGKAEKFRCSACGSVHYYGHYTYCLEYEFCPMCGAKMDGEEM